MIAHLELEKKREELSKYTKVEKVNNKLDSPTIHQPPYQPLVPLSIQNKSAKLANKPKINYTHLNDPIIAENTATSAIDYIYISNIIEDKPNITKKAIRRTNQL